MDTINLKQKFAKFQKHWTPKIIGELNGQYIKLAKVKDELVWHSHTDEDELFIVYKGTLYLDFRDKTVEVHEGEILVVPKGVDHLPRTDGEEVWLMLIEPMSTKHTGDVEHKKTTNDQEWI